MSGGSLLRHPPLRRVVTVAFVLVGPAVMVKTLDTSWICTYAILAMLSAVSLVFVATPKPTDGATDDESARRPLWMLAGSRSASRGVSDRVPVPARSSPKSSCSRLGRASALTTPIPLSGQVIWWSLAATVIAWTLRQTSRTRGPVAALGENLWTGLLRAFAGVAILLSLGNQVAFAIPPNAPFALATPLAWVAHCQPTTTPWTSRAASSAADPGAGGTTVPAGLPSGRKPDVPPGRSCSCFAPPSV